MARQAGPLFITGTIDELVFYKLGENYYVRQKGERTPGVKKRLKHDKGYALLQLKQREFGHASELVKQMYYTLPLEVRQQGLFGTLTGKAVRWLRQGKTEEEITALLRQLFAQEALPVEPPVHTTPAEKTTPEKTVSQPSKPAQKQKEKRSTSTIFSSWRVGANGMLQKEVEKRDTTLNVVDGSNMLHSTKGSCCVCIFKGWEFSVMDKSD